MAVPMLKGLAELIDRYDGFILDMWGVLHNGVHPFEGVLDALEQLRQAGKRCVILSNAPRRLTAVIERATVIGIPERLYDGIMSSGEDAWRHLATRHAAEADPWYRALGPRLWYMGQSRDADILDGLDFEPAMDAGKADVILNVGPAPLEEGVADYETQLQLGAAAGVPMVCANPDRVVVVGERQTDCAGALADRYIELGGSVRWHGKPDPGIYRPCLDMLGLTEHKDRVLAIGDSLTTDIAGANAAGIACALVPGGIHATALGADVGALPSEDKLSALLASHDARPDMVLPGLIW